MYVPIYSESCHCTNSTALLSFAKLSQCSSTLEFIAGVICFSSGPDTQLCFLTLKGTGIQFPAFSCFPKLLTLDLWMDVG